MVVFLGIITWAIPPSTSTARESGVTSSKRISFTSPWIIPPWIDAPWATDSSGFTVDLGSFPKISCTICFTLSILVDPPTRIMSLISDLLSFESERAESTGSLHLLKRSAVMFSNWALVSVSSRFLGNPSGPTVINGIEISTLSTEESCFLAFSASSLILCIAIVLSLRSIPSFALNPSTIWLMILWSQSAPPSWVSPDVESTWKVPSAPISRTVTSKVPPPRSNTTIFSSDCFPSP